MMQDISTTNPLDVSFSDYKINVDDILKIDVSIESVELSTIYNKNISSNVVNRESSILNGYKVDFNGNINFPTIGSLNILGMTTSEVADHIRNKLIQLGKLVNPSVDVKIVNSYFVLLGEVKSPGRYIYDRNNMDILQALAYGGDLTINGERKDIKVLRQQGNSKSVMQIDLTKSDFLESEMFQIFSGDIIIVNPNTSRVKNAGIIGNSGTLLSLLSFLLSLIIVTSSR